MGKTPRSLKNKYYSTKYKQEMANFCTLIGQLNPPGKQSVMVSMVEAMFLCI